MAARASGRHECDLRADPRTHRVSPRRGRRGRSRASWRAVHRLHGRRGGRSGRALCGADGAAVRFRAHRRHVQGGLSHALRCHARRDGTLCERHPGAPARRSSGHGDARRAAAGFRRAPSRSHPVHAHDLVEALGAPSAPDFGAASDGDGDRNLVVGRGFIVAPSTASRSSRPTRISRRLTAASPAWRARCRRAAPPTASRSGSASSFETPTGWKFSATSWMRA